MTPLLIAATVATTGKEIEMAIKTIYTTGYTGKKPEDLLALANRLNLERVIDIRYNAISRVPQWRQPALVALLGDRYYNITSLGNRAYKEERIEIPNLELGILLLGRYAGPLLLMCACEKFDLCHRRTVADELKAQGWTVIEIKNWKTFGLQWSLV